MFLLTLQSLHFSDMIATAFLHILQRVFALPTLGINYYHESYLQPIITQYFIDNKSEIWLLFLIAHSKR